ncbi:MULTISPECIES: Na+/H+ antiporter [Sphingomonas]|uniref:Na+/H+ antiporter n=1 Tax=Sphingomonas molluscorum TaxID=418184 RepID=A0ABU8Q6W5_9SPHN|nr:MULTISPECIES: Na+/H+ antiporter [unclassified Sphingomonas]MBM7406808.1 CPA1 family monovalent cation:H+ antiporter [Sphingomonas sp. JUb134]RSV15816.1 Na+/H+ antiporter [Sphingomonas sp. ABOLF]GLK21261.1 Na+/H+ antiporter [Microbacterium terregens]
MESVTIVLVLLLAVVVSGAVSRMVPFAVPAPLVQIALGAAIGLAGDWRVALDPELFFFLFLPPLLFLDGWRIPKDELFKDLPTVVELALGLVVITVLGMGLFIHWMIPAMPLAVAFALAAVVSPTDPIAVSAIAARVPIPKRMMHILEGESLLNDASGLVCLRFAIAAALTGTFSASSAALNFLWVAFGGLAIGVAVTMAVTWAKYRVSRRFGEEIGSQILVSLLIPFGSYLLAEHFHCSGILAAVAAGVTMSFAEISRQALPATRVRRNSVWDTIQFAANGIIFVLLGEQLPAILHGARETVALTGHQNVWWLALYVLAINVGLAALRFVWVWISLRLTLLRRGDAGQSPEWRLVAAMSFAGVRGAITLAGVLTLPLLAANGTPFPARDLAIFLAAGVIVTSLVVASIGLPLLLRGLKMPADASVQAEEDAARVAAAEAAIREIERVQHDLAAGRSDADLYASAGARIMDLYRERIEARSQEGEAAEAARREDGIERELRLAGLKAERAAIFRSARERRIGSATSSKLVRELDLLEARYRS